MMKSLKHGAATIVLSLLAVMAWSADGALAATPATSPTTAATKTARSSTKPSTRLASQPSTQGSINAKGLAEQIRKMKEEQASLAKVAHFDLTEPLLDRPLGFTLFPQQQQHTLFSLLERLNDAKDDKNIKGLLITLRGAPITLAQAGEIRDALREISLAGKPTYVYADSYETSNYVLASGASDICMLPGGDIMMPGVGLEVMFARGLLDKIGVKADFVQVGEYKGADEALTRTAGSEQLRGELTRLADSLYGQVVQLIATGRNLKPEVVKGLIDEAIISGTKARDAKLVDHLCDIEDLRDEIAKKVGQKVDLVRDYGVKSQEGLDLSNPFGMLAMISRRSQPEEGSAIGVLYVTGMIVDGDADEGLFGSDNTGDGQIRRGMRVAMRDDDIEAVVIRIDSPGGSALASEAAWQAIRRVAKEKPVVISVGGMAASGGYYIASAGDYVFADSTAIVGSIGVVGGKMVLHDLLSKIGVNTESFTRGANAALFSSSEPFSPGQRQMIYNWMAQTYKQFTDRVMTTRKGKIKDIDQVAKGRVFLAPQGRELGMVDAIGGLNDAIAYAAKKADLEPGDYKIRTLPIPRTLGDILAGKNEVTTPIRPGLLAPGVMQSLEAQLSLLPPAARHVVKQQLSLATLLERRPVALVTPWFFLPATGER